MKRILLLIITFLPISVIAQLALTWDTSNVNNCDADGSLSISNSGTRITALQMEGPDCSPCTTIDAAGFCALDASGGLCSDSPNVLTSIVDIGDYSSVDINIAIANTGTNHETQCSVSDWAFVQINEISNSQIILDIGEAGLESILNESLNYVVNDCTEQLSIVIITKSNSLSGNEGFVFDILISPNGSNSQIPAPQDASIDVPSIGCPGGFTEIAIDNCQACTQITAIPVNGGNTITSSGSSILIPIPLNAIPPLNYDIEYGNSSCSFTFPIDVPFINQQYFQSNFFNSPFCSGVQFSLPEPLNVGGTIINGNWSGPGVTNNIFTDPGNGAMTYTVTFTSTNCIGLQFDQDITISGNNYAGVNRLTGTEIQNVEYSADGPIESEQMILSPFDVSYNSGTEIILLDLFEVKKGAKFHAYIQGCI